MPKNLPSLWSNYGTNDDMGRGLLRKTGKNGNFFRLDFDDYDDYDEKDKHMMIMLRKERIGREVLATKLQ